MSLASYQAALPRLANAFNVIITHLLNNYIEYEQK